jgi:O-antigen ligase
MIASTERRSPLILPMAGLILAPALAAAVSPISLEGHAVLAMSALAALATLVVVWPGAHLSRDSGLLIALGAAASLIPIGTALWAENARVAIAGMTGSAQGASLWLAAWAALVAATAIRKPGGSASSAAAVIVAIVGALMGALAVLQSFGLAPLPAGWSGEPAGFSVGSNNLGQALVLAAGCATAWFASAAELRQRAFAAAALIFCVAGAAASQSRGALFALALIAVVAILGLRLGPRVRVAGVFAISATTLFLLVAVVALPLLPLDANTFNSVNTALNDRPEIWRSAAAQVAQSPLLGDGPEQFSTHYLWNEDPNAISTIHTTGTFSPHSLAWEALLATGLLGSLALAVGFGVFTRACAARARNDVRSFTLALGIFGWLIAAAIAPLDWLSLIWAAVIVGLIMSGGERSEADFPSALGRLIAPAAALALVITLIAVIPPLAEGLRWRQFPEVVDDAAFRALEASYARTRDPVFASHALSGALRFTGEPGYAPAIADDTRRLALAAAADAEWHVDVARYSVAAWALAEPAPGFDRPAEFAAALERGRRADPASGVWEYLESEGLREPTR